MEVKQPNTECLETFLEQPPGMNVAPILVSLLLSFGTCACLEKQRIKKGGPQTIETKAMRSIQETVSNCLPKER